MGSKTLTRLGHETVYWARHLTWQWFVFFLILASCVGLYVAVVMPMRHGLVETRSHASTMQRDIKRLQQASVEAARQAPAGQIDVFDAYFPAESTAPDTLELILNTAEKKGLNPKQAEYRVIKNNPGNLVSYQLTLPLKGAYPQLLDFISEVLSKVQNLSLDNIVFQRQKIGDAQVDSTLLLTLYLRRESAVENH